MEYFAAKRALLNPKFEGYKLNLIAQEDAVASFRLEHQPSQAAISGRSLFSYEEVQSRITHNHLAVRAEYAIAAYVDKDGRVVVINLTQSTPTFRVVFEIPQQIHTDGSDAIHREYASVAFVSSTTLAVSDGHGVLYIIQTNAPNQPADLLGIYRLPSGVPFRIHNISAVSSGHVAVLSSRHYDNIPESEHKSKPKGVKFNIWGVSIDPSQSAFTSEPGILNVLWQRRGEDVPINIVYYPQLESFILIGGSVYEEVNALIPKPYEPTPDEIAPIPRLDENLDTKTAAILNPPPYSWTQTDDSLTVAFPLPSNTPKSKIRVSFTSTALSLQVDVPTTSVPIPKYTPKSFWDTILPSTSYWTWDKEAEHTFGLLTLHLDKQNIGTKWLHVFSKPGTAPSSELAPEDIEVPETVDPSELWKVRESLEKYTAALREGDDASGLGLGRGMPSLAEGEMDDEVDDSVGRRAFVSWVDNRVGGGGAGAAELGRIPEWAKANMTIPIQVLSTPLPGTMGEGTAPRVPSIVVKNGLDGLVFQLKETTKSDSGAQPPVSWTHTSTYSALGFVLASKRDTRFTHHTAGGVFAFESGNRDRGGNVYIYRPAGVSDKWAKQSVLKVSEHGGSLLGVGAVQVHEGGQQKTLIVCLSEQELILLRDL
ncbi:hypothetical protein AX16_003040 [Volvariella volvacea WC 439]|nr:hypothetical protein AX16_003040 [Volvariella volvacea WC 439]